MRTDIIRRIAQKVRYNATVEWYNFWYIVLGKRQRVVPQIASIDETIRRIAQEGCSISRFGDGELLLTNPDKAIGFQQGSPRLAAMLREVLVSHEEGHLVCLSDTFTNLYRYNRKCRRFWRTHFFLYGSWWDRYLTPGRTYYNTFVTRPYMDFASKEASGGWFESMRSIWNNRDVVIIEGAQSRLGVGNDLFDGARSIRRILCPPRNAFERYDEILAQALKLEKGVLFLIALGPTATVLSYQLFKAGYQAVDAGHVDIEYEWWRMNAKRKVKIERKFVNEAAGGDRVKAPADSRYEQQIYAQIQ